MTEPVALPDVNVLVALTNPSHTHHDAAHAWLRTVDRLATAPVTESGLLRVLLNPVVTGQAVTTAQAVAILTGIRRDPRWVGLGDDTSLAEAVIGLHGLVGHRQVTDWHLVNLAASHGAVLVTFDGRLARSLPPDDAAHVRALV